MLGREVFAAAPAALQEPIELAEPVVGIAPALQHLHNHHGIVACLVTTLALQQHPVLGREIGQRFESAIPHAGRVEQT